MQLLRLTDVPPPNQSDRVFLYSRFRAVLGAALLAASAVAAFLLAWFNGAWLGYYIASVILILLLIFHNLVTARFRPSNWLLRASDDGLFIKFRSYLNHHFDNRDLTVVFFSYSEIRSAQAIKEIHHIPDRDYGSHAGTTTKTRRAIEIEIAADSTALSKLLANERDRIVAKSVVGAGKISTRYQHLPVRLIGPKRLRIDWGVVPSTHTLLQALTRHTMVQEGAEVSKDFTELEAISREQQEAHLAELVASGDTMTAVTLARQLYSYDLTAAKQFVEELAGRKSTR
jgi:hypothetical protein